MTRDELLAARVEWLTSAVRGLLKARADTKNEHARTVGAPYKEYEGTAAGQADTELRKEEDKHDLDLGPLVLRYARKKAQQALEDWLAGK